MLMVWFERKLISDMQNRIGPNKAGPWGLLQTLADGIKLFFKEDLIPDRADRVVFLPRPVPVRRAGLPRVLRSIPIGGDFDGGEIGTISCSATRPTCSSPTRRSACC